MNPTLLLSGALTALMVVQSVCPHQKKDLTVPHGFKYPELGETVVIGDEILARRLAGKVFDPNGDPVDRALVEVTTEDWTKRIAAVFTDRQGRFEFCESEEAEYHIKITQYGFAPLRARIRLSKSASTQLRLDLFIAN